MRDAAAVNCSMGSATTTLMPMLASAHSTVGSASYSFTSATPCRFSSYTTAVGFGRLVATRP